MTNTAQAEAARVLLAALADAGVREVVIAPGSRSTPLVLAAAAEARFSISEIIDERSAAFFALGQARVTGRPSLMITTSGTAGAHAYPAILEAEVSNLPLIVATADRPLELQNCGALQTIDQRDLFGRHVAASFEVSLGDRRALERVAAQAVQARRVHLNVKASKPLEVEAPVEPLRKTTRIEAGRTVPEASTIAELSRLAQTHVRGVIVAGPMPLSAAKMREDVFALSERTGWPLLAEAASQLRFTRVRPSTACDLFEPLLRSPKFKAEHEPTFVLQLGMMPTSGAYDLWIRERPKLFRAIIAEHGVPDATSSADLVVNADPALVIEGVLHDLLQDLRKGMRSERGPGAWAKSFKDAEARARSAIEPELARGEAAIVRAVIDHALEDVILLVGNGLPIRHVDLYIGGERKKLGVLSQRGASGIDGLVSGAAGAASVAGGKPVLALIGDVSLLHDLHGLAAAKSVKSPLVIVAIHNDGGRIFEQLPIGAHREADRFTTPHGTDFEHAARLFGVRYTSIEDLPRAQESSGPTLIVPHVDPHDARDAYARIWRKS